ncbi:MAG: C25 family cysteine peptidase [Bacteroidia bacterium]
MKKIYMLFSLFICLPFILAAQPFGNEWINYDQTYFRIPIVTTGVYRISSTALLEAIPQLSGTDPRNIQLFGRGEEQAIYVNGEDDGSWDDGDFVEFFAHKNDGWLDASLYANPDLDQSNKNYSLFSDTAVYFLTWNSITSNLRMSVETDVDFAAYPTAPYFIREVINQQTNNYYFGKTDFNNSTDPDYTEGEGWSGPVFSAPLLNQISNIPSANKAASGPEANLRIVYKTISNAPHFLDHRFQLKLANLPLKDTLMEGHGSRAFSFNLPLANVGATTTAFTFSYLGITANNGNPVTSNAVYSNYVWKYPHNFNMENQGFYRMLLPDNASGDKYLLNMTSVNAGGGSVFVFDVSNRRRIQASANGTAFRAIVPNGNGSDKEIYLCSNAQILNLPSSSLSAVNAGSGQFTDLRDYPGTDFLIVTHRSFQNEASAYKAYRSGKFSTEVFFVDELYDQFAYGVRQHPLSIKNFANTAFGYWDNEPEYLLLLGKSISSHYLRNDPETWNQSLVPTYGFPSCDMLLTAGLNGALPFEPALATGRISASSANDISAYLNKLQEYEGNEPAMWMKQVLHFGGGQSQSEQQSYLNYLSTYENTIEDTLFGGTVYTYQKTSSAPIEQTQSAIISDYINNGVSLMTFFGHATGSGFDVSIDDPASYSNQGKYPFLVGNSCYAGDIHQPPGFGFSQSEEFTLIPNRGTIGFIASVALGIPNQLHTYTDTLYRYMSQRYYGEPMAMNMKRTARAVYSTDPFRKAVILETTLHGDPGVALNGAPLPDYFTTQPDVFFNPEDVTTEVDSFRLNIVVSNVGRAIDAPLTVEVVRNFPNSGLTTTYSRLIGNPYFRDTLVIAMPVTDIIKGGVGINTFDIRIDPLNQRDELSETNNNISATLLIRSAEVLPVWPYEFAVVPNNTVTLRASTGDPFAPVRNYIFEADTTDLFNSPFKITQTINQSGGVLNWDLPLVMQDSMVIFWRVSPDSLPGGSYQWKESSFQYISGQRGWAQDHFFQFKKNQFNQINYQRSERYFDFVTNAKELSCNAYGFPWEIDELWATSYKIDAEVWADAGCSLDGAIYIAVIDSVTLLPWLSPENCWEEGNQYGQFNNTCQCKNGNRMANFVFRNEAGANEMIAMRDMLNAVPNGHYILAYTWIYGNYQNWDPSVMQAFLDLGADSISTLPNEYPYIFMVKKGHPETAIEMIADSANANLSLSAPMFNSWVSGDFTSTLIGPGSGWDTLSWKSKNVDNPLDSIRIQVKGIRPNGQENIILEATTGANGDIDLSPIIGLDNYTYVRLNAFMRDDSLRTPVQLDRWQLSFDPVPECALNPLAGLYLYNDTLQQGDSLKLAIAIQNISELPMDSMLVAYWIQDINRNIFPVNYSRQKPLAPGEILFDTVAVSTLPYSGLNSIWVEANPNMDQPEQFRFNNLGSLNFYVGSDNVNPLLDVTFDAVHIINGDIISPKPEISIQLKDENPYLALDDTSSFQIYLKLPSGNTALPVYFNSTPAMEFIPGSLPDNKARILWRAEFLEDGTYDFIVKARDRSNNASGSVQYSISFEVVNKSTITNILNYPNPFSTKTHFVFTLTGSQVPDQFRIQIMTITGKVIKDIRKDELGTIRIGRNVTDYAWDGRDEFGDRLANGIYLYRVMTSIDGKDIERRESGADTYFERGFGKMYLIN